VALSYKYAHFPLVNGFGAINPTNVFFAGKLGDEGDEFVTDETAIHRPFYFIDLI
jgi:hypothetical protein